MSFMSSETYYTRGAFIDVVINQQTCNGVNNINLDENEYLDSYIENLVDYVKHDRKEKYLFRMNNAASHLHHINIDNNDLHKQMKRMFDYLSINFKDAVKDVSEFVSGVIRLYESDLF